MPRGAVEYAPGSRVTHTCQWTSAFSAVSSIMILKANVEMPPPIKSAIDARLS